jgi:pimeloyl-ACP methyl ester carboxylesterase
LTLHNRRSLFRAGALAAVASTAAAGTAQASPTHTGRRGSPTFVLVPGAYGRASGRGRFVNELVLRGHRALAVELPNHDKAPYTPSYQAPQNLEEWAKVPSPLAGLTLRDYVDHTVGVVRRVAAHHGPVILVGASAGGLVISLVANAVPRLIQRLVYDDAFCCAKLPSLDAYYRTPEAAGSHNQFVGPAVVGNPEALGALRVNWRSADPTFLAEAKLALLTPDAPDSVLLDVLNTLHPDNPPSINHADARGHLDTWGRVPRTFIRHSLDGLLPLALQDRMIRESDELTPGNRFDVHTVVCGHAAEPGTAPENEILDILADLA